MKTLFAILLVVIPIAWDLIAGRIYWKKKRIVDHMFTAGVRLVIMALLAFLNSVSFGQSILLSVAFHYAFFPPLYNRIIINQPWHYIGKSSWTDKIESWIAEKTTGLVIIWFKACLLGVGIVFYVHGCLRCW